MAKSSLSLRHSGFDPRVDPYSGLHAHATGYDTAGQVGGSGQQYMSAFRNPDVTIGNFANQSVNWTKGRPMLDESCPLSAHSNRSHVSTVSRVQERQQLKSMVSDLGSVVRDMQLALCSDQLSIANKFAIELAKVLSAHDRRFEKMVNYISCLDESIEERKSLPGMPVGAQVSRVPILKLDYDPTIAFIDKAIDESDRKRNYNYADMYRAVFNEDTSCGIPLASEESRVHDESHVDISVKNYSSQVPAIPGNATPVVQQPVPTHQHPTQPIPPSSPMFYPSEPIKRPNPDDPEKVWKERVALQRVRSSQQRTFGRTEIPDQGIGFDEDSLPVDKDTTPREVWSRDYREAQRRGRDDNLRPPSEQYNSQPPNNFMGGATGGNSGDPGGDSSDDDHHDNRDRRKDDKHPKKGCRRQTPWDDESSSDDESDYLTDSVFSKLEDESEDDTKGRCRR
ncbi:hypothetical protein PQX77_016728 [Marasmius sp. AFHP31]|nr:hypothetical protein PQX77_016728 [Marasmius sp. AFHP31]